MHKKVAFMGVFLALALILSYIESCIPFFAGVPGMKLGLTNVLVVLLLYLYGPKEALGINVLRILLAGFLFGNAFAILYGLAGGFCSFCSMYLLKRWTSLRIPSISVAGGIMHNFGQVIVASFVVENYHLVLYFPVLFIAGILTGIVIGVIVVGVYPHLKVFLRQEVE